MKTSLSSAIALTLLQTATAGWAGSDNASADAASGNNKELSSVIVTGTRKTDMTVTDSPAPIQVVSAETLKETNAPDLMNAIALLVPSYNANQVGVDMASQTLTAALRGLSANHTLILINGKRLHNTANVNPNNGDESADLSFIPQDAIDHVEVLTDGAAALYGSDAIAGVINIILKKNYHGGEVNAGYAAYGDGGGKDPKIGANLAFGDEKNFFSLSAEGENRQSVSRFGPQGLGQCILHLADCQANSLGMYGYYLSQSGGMNGAANLANIPLNSRFPDLNTYYGPPEVHRDTLYFNSGAQLSEDISFYAFGGVGKKRAQSQENYRTPAQLGGYPAQSSDPDTGAYPTTGQTYMYPTGFNPSEAAREKDFQLTAGLTGNLAGWTWDFSSSYGKDIMNVYTLNSENPTLYTALGYSPSNFYDGAYFAGQSTTNINLTRDFEVGLSAPLTFNAGFEYRKDTYGIEQGEPASYEGVGASSFPGYGPTNTGSWNRNAKSLFADVVVTPVEHWLVDVAARYEDYSDFGSKLIGKITSRYDFNDTFAIRGTASTGFRAPTLGEEYYTAVQVSPTGASPTLQPNSAASQALGFGKLKPETSTNYSLGFVFHPQDNLSSTLDFYRITIANRVTASGFYYTCGHPMLACDPVTGAPSGGSYNAALGQALVGAGYLGAIDPGAAGGSLDPSARDNIEVQILTNAARVRTQGLDWVTNWHTEFGGSSIDWMLALNYNKYDVLSVQNAPAALGGGPLVAGGDAGIQNLEHNQPKYRINFGPTFNVGKFNLAVTEQIYGPQYQWVAAYTSFAGDPYPASVLSQVETATFDGAPYFKERIGVLAVTNLNLTFKPNDSWVFSVGGNNIFDKYPNGWPKAIYQYELAHYENQFSFLGPYQTSSPLGFFGAYWYANLTYKF